MAEELKIEVSGTHGSWKGKELEGIEFQHPFLEMRVPGVLADYVTLDQGSGIVHTAPGHGADDFRTGQKYGLEAYAPQDDEGRFVEGLPEYKGKTVFEANPIVIEMLKKRGMLVGERKLTHSYPHCWRCHNPVIFRATEQWFIELDHDNLRQNALAEIAKVKWKPEWGEARIHDMIAERPDWCISRQRFWGVPLIIFYCERAASNCGIMRRCATCCHGLSAKARTRGTRIRRRNCFRRARSAPAARRNGARKATFSTCGLTPARRISPCLSEKDGTWPADVYLEGPDQYRGWFHSSLLVAVGIRGRAPYREVVTHGWTLDEKGAPMSKSLGNAMYPNEICDKWGADLLRVWVASQDYTTDMRMSVATMTQLAEAYRKIRNTFRFALSNLFDFDPAVDSVPDDELWEMDAWMLRRTGAAGHASAANGTTILNFIAPTTRFTISAPWT